MRSTLGGIIATNKLLLTSRLNLTQEMLGAFRPTIVKGTVTPDIEEAHLIEEGDEEDEEGGDREETLL